MKRLRAAGGILAGLMIVTAILTVGLPTIASANRATEWPFGGDPQDAFSVVPQGDFVVTIGSRAWTPGSAVLANVGAAFRADPFFTRGMTEFAILPTFAAGQALETGLRFDWWSAFVDVNLSLAPWALTSAGAWLDIHPPEWAIVDRPAVSLDTRLGWGPQWSPAGGWSHALAGDLDVRAGWVLSTFWDNPLDLTATSNLSAAWTFPSGNFAPDWQVLLDARSVLPVFQDNAVALRAGVVARVHILPTFGFGFDMQLEFRAHAFYAYGLVGAGGAGIRAEIGAEMTFGLTLFEGLD